MNTNLQKTSTVLQNIVDHDYEKIISALSVLSPFEYSKKAVERVLLIDKLLNNVSASLDLIYIGGNNGGDLAARFTAQLLHEEHFKTGTILLTHIVDPTEQIESNGQKISSEDFAQNIGKVLEVCKKNNLVPTQAEAIMMGGLLYFQSLKTEVITIECSSHGANDPAAAFLPKIYGITQAGEHFNDENILNQIKLSTAKMLEISKPGTLVVSGEQSKLLLPEMKAACENVGGIWEMPVRKSSKLPSIYEQMYGRIASISERIALIYAEHIKEKVSLFLRGALPTTKIGKRGRPTNIYKKTTETMPMKTLDSFWTQNFRLPLGNFELLNSSLTNKSIKIIDKVSPENPVILLDVANKIETLENLFLGIRLLSYQNQSYPFHVVMIMNVSKNICQATLFKNMRYLSKRVNLQVIFIEHPIKEWNHSLDELVEHAIQQRIAAKKAESAWLAYKQILIETVGKPIIICMTGSEWIVRQYHKKNFKF